MRLVAVAAVLSLTGCYHYAFEQREQVTGEATVRHEIRVPTYVNGLVGTGVVDTKRYCAGAAPIRTELQVRPMDVLLSVVTLLIYTPHTLYVTCGIATPLTTTSRSR